MSLLHRDEHTDADGAPDGKPSIGARLRFLGKPGWIAAMLGAIAFAVVCYTVLAPWQFSRHDDRSTRNAAIAAAVGAPVQPLDRLLPADDPNGVGQDEVWRQVSATGTFLPGKQVVVGLRQDNAGQPAGEVLAAFQLADGTVLVVDRGYVPLAELTGGAAAPDPPNGQLTVTGRLQPFQPDPLDRPAQRIGDRIEVRGIAADSIPDLPGPVRNGFIQLSTDSPAVLNPVAVPQTEAGPFLSYAWQWLVFGAMGILAVGFFIVREFTDPREEREEREAAADANAGGRSGADVEPADTDGAPLLTSSERGRRRRKFDRSQLYDPS